MWGKLLYKIVARNAVKCLNKTSLNCLILCYTTNTMK